MPRAPRDLLPGACHFVSKGIFPQGTRQRQPALSQGEQPGCVHRVRARVKALVLNPLAAPARTALFRRFGLMRKLFAEQIICCLLGNENVGMPLSANQATVLSDHDWLTRT
ncbi:hypothetical protein J2R76_003646 [Bradyrhizobium sp. USDA 4532]|nr:hypothetical protein [Bradyrhizobium sp. USDA 4545]MCP1920055.1 hypothetical protein [Bradyrhizobium sp. USDA 4532]